MTIKHPTPAQIPALRQLWKQAFGDTDAFLDDFFRLAFSGKRCFCVTEAGRLVSALYWFDCQCQGQKLAYLYAVATDTAFQNRGICRALMEHTHRHLTASGYAGALLVPGSEGLFRFYEKMGYRTATAVRTFTCTAGITPVPLRKIDAAAYAALRRQLLPTGGVIQGEETLALLEAQCGFFAGDHSLLAGTLENDSFRCVELLGDASAAPGVLCTLGASTGQFRTPGSDTPFSMYLPLAQNPPTPAYFGFALD